MTIPVYFLSDRTAITAETLGLSLLAQFPDHRFRTQTIPFIDSADKARAVSDEISAAMDAGDRLPSVVCTMADDELMAIIHQAKALIIDPFGDHLPRLEKVLAAQHHQPGQSHRTANPSVYESRIDAIEFAMACDDGTRTQHYDRADIILVGVSRSGKTPSSLYLALQFGIRAANYPITEDDLEYDELPKPLRAHVARLYGLTTDLERLMHVRRERRPQSRYASMEQCRFELRAVEKLFQRYAIKYLNTARISVEEIAARIIRDAGLHRVELS